MWPPMQHVGKPLNAVRGRRFVLLLQLHAHTQRRLARLHTHIHPPSGGGYGGGSCIMSVLEGCLTSLVMPTTCHSDQSVTQSHDRQWRRKWQSRTSASVNSFFISSFSVWTH